MKTAFRILVFLTFAISCRATGFYGPTAYLDNGGANVDASPEFYWAVETERLASGFHPTEKFRITDKEKEALNSGDVRPALPDATADADIQDFAAALKDGSIKPADPAAATKQHQDARDFLATMSGSTTDALPEEFPSEFADYHRGAYAYCLGGKHWPEAQKAWEDLLQRPPAERHYRTVWAAFMLGKLAMKSQDYPAAVKWFQQTRELAKQGFADSMGMAADSYGWEGRCEWKQNHPEKAAPLFLTQLALGDETAIVSLKALIPDRDPVEGMLNYGEEPDDGQKQTDQQKQDADRKALDALAAAAKDPLMRRLVTVHILATASYSTFDETPSTSAVRCTRWLRVIGEAGLQHIPEAEYLGWVAYNAGDYKGAARWLAMGDASSPASWWLRAKLQRRAGHLADAAKSMAQVWQSIHDLANYTGTTSGTDAEENSMSIDDYGPKWSFDQSAAGDFAALRLVQANFVEALDLLRKTGLDSDAAYIAERVLTANELKAYVDTLPPAPPAPRDDDRKDTVGWLRYLLGRRFVREDRYDEAAPYLPAPYAKVLAVYVKALKDGADTKLSRTDRARAWFTAAWIARFDGMELMGTEGAPDAFDMNGDFEDIDLAAQRQSGFYTKTAYTDGGEKDTRVPIALKPAKLELQRLAENQIRPDIRFHYRIVAAALAMRAAQLMPEETEELADVVNTAGSWVKDRDEKLGDRYYQAIEQRCAKTKIGQADIAKHWFVDQAGPWSDAQQKALDALEKQAGVQTQQSQ